MYVNTGSSEGLPLYNMTVEEEADVTLNGSDSNVRMSPLSMLILELI